MPARVLRWPAVLRKRVYQSHQAFNRAFQEIQGGTEKPQGYEFARRYHHAPDKLFARFEGYQIWASELYKDGQALVKMLFDLSSRMYDENPRWWQSTKKLKAILDELGDLEADIMDFRADVAECQRCWLASDIFEKVGYIESLSDLVNQLDSLQYRTITGANAKIAQVNSIRLTYAGLLLSVVAVLIAVVSR